MPIASPCINVCQIDESTGICAGCLRTLDEIARWSVMSESEKAKVLAQLPERPAGGNLSPAATPPSPRLKL